MENAGGNSFLWLLFYVFLQEENINVLIILFSSKSVKGERKWMNDSKRNTKRDGERNFYPLIILDELVFAAICERLQCKYFFKIFSRYEELIFFARQ